MSDNQVFDIVNEKVQAHQPRDYKLHVLRDGMSHSGRWWYVVVQPDKPDIRAYDYSTLMQRIEHEIESEFDLNVLLIPVMPD